MRGVSPYEVNIPTRDAVDTQLSKILSFERFLKSERLKDFLTFVVKEHLDGNAEQLKETTIALAVFGKKPDFDPKKYAIVRTTANRLRAELENYYNTVGKEDSLLIELPKGRYIPQFTVRPKTNGISSPEPFAEPTPLQPALPARRSVQIKIWFVAALALVLGAGFWSLRPHQHPITAPVQQDTQTRRLFARSTSEGQAPRRINTGKIHSQLVITPDGKKLYAFSRLGNRDVTVLSVDDLQVKRTFDLPLPLHTASMSNSGRHIYISADTPADSVMVLDTANDRVVDVIPTGVPAFGIVVTPDEKKLFLALGHHGLKRIDLKTRESRILSAMACPIYLGIDPAGRRLYVSYQGGGPGGRWGHDSVDIYDVASEQSVGLITGLAFVGGLPVVSPGGDLVLLNGLDACSSPAYDHVGCPSVPSPIFHLWQTSGRRVISPIAAAAAAFLPQGPRILLLNGHMAVWDWARRTILEQIDVPGVGFEGVAFTPAGDRLFVSGTVGLLAFDAEKEECLPPTRGLVNLYSGDGTFDDSQGMASLTSASLPHFAPGSIGQAFRFNGRDNFLQATGSFGFCTFCEYSWTESLSIKLNSTAGEMTILERVPGVNVRAHRIYKAENNHIVYEGDDGPQSKISMSSLDPVEPGRWYHVAAVTDKDRVSLYLDGILQDQHAIRRPFMGTETLPVFLGATQGKHNFLSGLIDEIAVYNRALSPDEVKKIARPCSPLK
jgi:YVTN family beta-propeller protein